MLRLSGDRYNVSREWGVVTNVGTVGKSLRMGCESERCK